MMIGALHLELRQFCPEKAAAEYPWADRFVMGLPLVPWQRDFKWSTEQSRRFITSAWTGCPLGSYMVTDMELERRLHGIRYVPLTNALIDGQQRLRTLELYFTNQLAVPDAGGRLRLWEEVDRTDQRRFQNTIFDRAVIKETDETALRRAYDLLNFGGTAHLEHERALPADADAAVGESRSDTVLRPRG